MPDSVPCKYFLSFVHVFGTSGAFRGINSDDLRCNQGRTRIRINPGVFDGYRENRSFGEQADVACEAKRLSILLCEGIDCEYLFAALTTRASAFKTWFVPAPI